MSSTVACECCKKTGRRRNSAYCPEGWQYAEVTDTDPESLPSDGDRTFVIMVCSQECAANLFKQGPGKLDTSNYKEPDALARQEECIDNFKRTDFYKQHKFAKVLVSYLREDSLKPYMVTVYEPTQQAKTVFYVEAYENNHISHVGSALQAIFPNGNVFNLPLEEYQRRVAAHWAVFGQLHGQKKSKRKKKKKDLPTPPAGFFESLCSDDDE